MNLKASKIIKVEKTEGCTCDHCGTGIKNVVTIRCADGELARIGVDCASKVGLDDAIKPFTQRDAVRGRNGWVVWSSSKKSWVRFNPIGWVFDSRGRNICWCFVTVNSDGSVMYWRTPSTFSTKKSGRATPMKLKKGETFKENEEHPRNKS